MKLIPTHLPDVFLLEPERHADERGFFARTFCAETFRAHGLDPRVAQCNVSFNARRGTLRGMHWQAAPHGETKLVRCTAGAIYDVAVDLRSDSPTYLRWTAAELTAENRRALVLPEGFAHGFLTLADDTEVFYQMSVPFAPEAARGARYDDPAFGIDWPEPVRLIKDRDAAYPDFPLAGEAA